MPVEAKVAERYGHVAGGVDTTALLDELLDAGLLVPTGIQGLYGHSAVYQGVADGVSVLVSRWAAQLRALTVRFPPLLSRRTFRETNYLESFPDLMGSVHVFGGGTREHEELLRRVEAGGDWPALLEPADVVLASAACHAVYPLCRGVVPPSGRYFDVMSHCFRHEPSPEPTRLQSFVMHEVVYVGEREGAESHRDLGLERGLAMLESLGLDMSAVPASDPFFGRVGKVLSASQLEEELKIEGVTPVRGNAGPTAIMSANCHRDHFAHPFGIETASGEPAHSSCVAFGIDRVVVALLARHGMDPSRWAPSVRSLLRL
ncbi:MAG: amino acid--[acyl-carrier-protein] ligase [Acidimicrobiales bacterium]